MCYLKAEPCHAHQVMQTDRNSWTEKGSERNYKHEIQKQVSCIVKDRMVFASLIVSLGDGSPSVLEIDD